MPRIKTMFDIFNIFKRKKLPKVKGKYMTNVMMSKHTWFGVGGPAETMFIPHDIKDLQNFLINKPKGMPLCIIGGGSNLLVRDGGILGIVIKLDSPYFKQYKIEEDKITLFAGFKNVDLKKILLEKEIGGLEFLCSIPGTIGGAIRTNAGCFGSSISDVLLELNIINKFGEIRTVPAEDLNLSYRSSFFPDDWIVASVVLKTKKGNREEIAKTLEDHKNYRIQSQPYNQKTAGSTFKNPEGLSAWELIKKSDCSDLQIGGAKVSDKHCNFLINTGNATAKDIETLGETIIKKVFKKTSITLEWEVRKLGIGKK